MTKMFLIKCCLGSKSFKKKDQKVSKKKDQKITLISIKFSMKECEKIKNEHRLRPTTQDLLHLMYEYQRLHKINDTIIVHSVDDQLQKIETDTCGIFQLYFYFNLFIPFENSSILKDTNLSKRTIEKLLNEIFSLNRNRNEEEVTKFTKEKDIKSLYEK